MIIRYLIAILVTGCLQAAVNIIPAPNKLVELEGFYSLERSVTVQSSDASLLAEKEYLDEWLRNATKLKVEQEGKNFITLALDPKLESEGYTLTVDQSGVRICGKTAAGVFYGIQSLKQLFPADSSELVKLPKIRIEDAPRFGWRGMHLDVSRHFYSKEFIKKYIDYLAMYKMNTFHWHLVDGPGWRIEIKKYPRLTEVGGWRKDKTKDAWDWRATEIHPNGKQVGDYGGYYTQEDIREIVAYAQQRHITVVPEIEMPGHSYAVLLAYPELACPTNKIATEGLRGKDVFCVGNEKTYTFLEDILDEVITLFPSQRIHIGADEVSKVAWKQCPLCQMEMKKTGLTNEEELQSHFVRRMEKYLVSKGRTLIGWDEINEGGLPEKATVMVWRDEKFARIALEQNHQVVMCPSSHCYFDYYQADEKTEPVAIGGYTPTQKVYSYEPFIAGLSEEQKELVLGAQANVWTEYIQTPKQLEYMIFPRMCALSEVVWTQPEHKDWVEFKRRVEEHKKLWVKQGIHFFDKDL